MSDWQPSPEALLIMARIRLRALNLVVRARELVNQLPDPDLVLRQVRFDQLPPERPLRFVAGGPGVDAQLARRKEQLR